MARYFHISNGLRGCYMPDASGVYRFETRRELREYLMSERDHAMSGCAGASVKAIAAFAAHCWRRAPAGLPFCLPLKPQGATSYSYGVFISSATRAEWREFQRECESA